MVTYEKELVVTIHIQNWLIQWKKTKFNLNAFCWNETPAIPILSGKCKLKPTTL